MCNKNICPDCGGKRRFGIGCATCGLPPVCGDGRHMSITDAQIMDILAYYTAPIPKLSIHEYCYLAGISVPKYKRVAHLLVKQPKDRQRIIAIAVSMGLGIDFWQYRHGKLGKTTDFPQYPHQQIQHIRDVWHKEQ